MQSIDYITYNDLYGGIYQSQVIDVVEYLNNNFDVKVNLKAFVPLKLWKEQARTIKSHFPEAKVYPILGRVSSVSRTKKQLRKRDRVAICRGPLAFELGRSKYEKLVYDGRAAVKAEVEEYNAAGSIEVGDLLINAERNAVEKADVCIAVSHQLVRYWKDKLKLRFDEQKVVVIPCTLSVRMKEDVLFERKTDEVRVIYSGGTGPWQSFDKVTNLLSEALDKQSSLKAIFLTREHDSIEELMKKYPDRVERKWLKHEEVNEVLGSCDYGILIRDNCWTNRVASPVKFAEYLNAGLKVLISEELGDYSEVVRENGLGLIVNDHIPELEQQTPDEKEKSRRYCAEHLTKQSETIHARYKDLLSRVFMRTLNLKIKK